jgi:hypothetical protein
VPRGSDTAARLERIEGELAEIKSLLMELRARK